MEKELYIFIILIAAIIIFVIGVIVYDAARTILESFAHFISIIGNEIDNDIKFKNNLLRLLELDDELNNHMSTADPIDKSDDDKSNADSDK